MRIEQKEKPCVTRKKWPGNLDFMMSCISLSVGLGNVWRFPFTAYENGGGAFVVPYLVVLLLIDKPIFYLEALLGQFSSKNSVKIWSVCPIFCGVGVGQAYAAIVVLTYYSALIGIAFYYIVISIFKPTLPWTYCRGEWAGYCVNASSRTNCTSMSLKLQSSSELYFKEIVLDETKNIDDGIGLPNLRLSLSLLATWIIVFIIVIKGVKSLGKISYFLAIFPYIMLLTLFIRAVTLEGAIDGIIYFLKPNWTELLNLRVWKEAVVQCFFSLTLSMGTIITFSSYNKFNHKVHRDTLIVTTLDSCTSFLAGITIFGIIGNLAHNLNIDNIDKVVHGGTRLAFITYPEAIAKFKNVPQLFSVLFFFMLFILGIGSIVALQNTIVTIIVDHFKLKRFWIVSLLFCLLGFTISLLYVTPGGQWILTLVNYYAGSFVIFCFAVLEIIGICWIYGTQNFCDDVEFMTNQKVSTYWRLCWAFFTPVILLTIFIYTMITIEPLSYRGQDYPLAADIAGWIVLAIGLIQFPIWALWHIQRHSKNGFWTAIRNGVIPDHKWGPSDPDIKEKWQDHKRHVWEERKKDRESKKISILLQKFGYFFNFGQ